MSFTSAPLPKLSKSINDSLSSNAQNSVNEDLAISQKLEKNMTRKQSKQKYLGIEINEDLKFQKEREFNQKDEGKQKQPPKGNILHISNICSKLHYQKIKRSLFDIFCVYGRIYDILIKTKESGQHFAFIDYDDIKDAQKAWTAAKKQGLKLQGRPLFVNYCEDPKKNVDRKSQKCFLCHQSGHKAIKCPVKPEMIKKKPKKVQQQYEQDDTNYVQMEIKNQKEANYVPEEQNYYYEAQQNQESYYDEKKRDKDYLRFLKLKKKLLQKKLNKKVKKSKKRKN